MEVSLVYIFRVFSPLKIIFLLSVCCTLKLAEVGLERFDLKMDCFLQRVGLDDLLSLFIILIL